MLALMVVGTGSIIAFILFGAYVLAGPPRRSQEAPVVVTPIVPLPRMNDAESKQMVNNIKASPFGMSKFLGL